MWVRPRRNNYYFIGSQAGNRPHSTAVIDKIDVLAESEFIVRARDHSGFVFNFGPIRQATR